MPPYRGGPYGSGTNRPRRRSRRSTANAAARTVARTARTAQRRVAAPVTRKPPVLYTPISRRGRRAAPRRVVAGRQPHAVRVSRHAYRPEGRKVISHRAVAQARKRERARLNWAVVEGVRRMQPRLTSGIGAESGVYRRFIRGFRRGAGHAYGDGASGYGTGKVGPVRVYGANADTASFAVSALEQTTRPLHGLAGGIYAAQTGHDVLRGTLRGLANKDKRTFSDVLGKAGVHGPLQHALGLGLDVALDPTTYVSFGTTSVPKALSRGAERKVARESAEVARRAGATPAEAQALHRAARALALRDVRSVRGATVGLQAFGRGVRTSGRVSARAARATGAASAGRAVRRTAPVQVAGRALRPGFRPKGVPNRAWQRARRAERTARAMRTAGARQAQARAVAYFRAMKGLDQRQIIHAVETGQRLKDPRAQRIVDAIRHDMAEVHHLERQAGLVGDPLPNYFPHKLKAKLLPGGKKLAAGKKAKLESSKERKLRDTLEGLRAQGFDEFSDDIALVVGARRTQSAHARANAHLISEVASTGSKYGLKSKLREGEWVYEVSKRDVPRRLSKNELADLRDEMRRVGPQAAMKGREFRVLHDQVVKHALGPQSLGSVDEAVRALGRFWDRSLQGRFKTLVTVPNPQYHLTNLYGDSFNAFVGDSRLLTSSNAVHSARALNRLRKREKVSRELDGVLNPSRKGVKIKGKRVSYDDLVTEAERVGAIKTGFIGRDLPEVLDAMGKELAESVGKGRFARRLHAGRFAASKVGRVVTHPIDATRKASEYREDFIRLATYIEARKRGMAPAEAAEHVSKYHFDYGDLTEFERTVLRRIFPFYTFTARNFPLQAERLVTRPGKYATLQKVREEGRKATGLPEGYEQDLTPYQRRQQPIPFPFQVPGVTGGSQNLLNAKLPSTDLGRLTPDLTEQQNYVLQMLSPLISVPLEYPLNFSFFFREPIDKLYQESDGKVEDYSPAPQWLGDFVSSTFGEAGLRKLGMYKAPARKGGPTVWVWPKRVNYLYGHLGPAAGTAQRVGNPAENQAGQGTSESLFGFATGLKIWPYDKARIGTDVNYRRRDELQARAALYRRRGLDKRRDGSYTPQYRRLLDRLNRLNKQLDAGSTGPARSGGGGGGWGAAGAGASGGGGWGSAGR